METSSQQQPFTVSFDYSSLANQIGIREIECLGRSRLPGSVAKLFDDCRCSIMFQARSIPQLTVDIPYRTIVWCVVCTAYCTIFCTCIRACTCAPGACALLCTVYTIRHQIQYNRNQLCVVCIAQNHGTL